MAIPMPPFGVDPSKIRPADLLTRRIVTLDVAGLGLSIEGRVVLVTGAGGTIGGELSRQIASYAPKKLLLLENSATALFYVETELRERFPGVHMEALLGDIRDRRLIERALRESRPQMIVHAAAHKHVGQLESNVYEGVSNNLLGTYHLARTAEGYGVETFLFISTDKAVRPRCVMGATKRAAEIALSSLSRASRTRFIAVRFGNVLGSSGSVLKIFQEQLAKGQPVTITHPEAQRYFMTVEEAVGLVLEATLLAKGGQIYMLKMGEPVRILDLAHRLIRLSGLEPGRDVEIRVVGLKPGEKIAEELIENLTDVEPSTHPDILVVRPEDPDVEKLPELMSNIEALGPYAAKAELLRALVRIVPTYTPDPVHGVRAAEPAPSPAAQQDQSWAEKN